MALAFSCFACCGVLMFGVLVFWSSGVALLLLLLRLRRPSPSLLLSTVCLSLYLFLHFSL
jgi:hypothetical protein